MEATIFVSIAVIIIAAALGAIFSRLLKQPPLVGYILAGLIIGPAVLGILTNQSLIVTLSELGIAFLLFFVGLEFDISKIRKIGASVAITGILQVLIVTTLGALLAYNWFDIKIAVYIGLILAFSSTMVVIKLISDKREIDTLHGRILLGILLIQDIIVIFILPFLASSGITISSSYIMSVILKVLFLLILVILLQKFIFKNLLKSVSENPELLFIISLAVCFIFLGLTYVLGFSLAIGGFVAGVSLASQPYNLEIAGRIKSLKDLFAILFFVSLGSQLTLDGIHPNMFLFLIGTIIIVILLKPIIIFLLLKIFKYSNRVALLSAASLGQISEFSLIIAVQAFFAGLLSQSVFNIIIVVTIVSIILTGYIIKYDEKIFSWFSDMLIPLEKFTSKKNLESLPKNISGHIVLFGADRMGERILTEFKNKKDKIIIVDFNPEIIHNLIKRGFSCIYGDYGNQEVLDNLKLEKAKIVVSTIPSVSENLLVIDLIKSINPKAAVVVTARAKSEAFSLYENGADLVILPEVVAGQRLAEFIHTFKTKEAFRKACIEASRRLRRETANEISD